MKVSAYGKLPLSEEYLRFNCNDGPALELKEWIDEGFDQAGRRDYAEGRTEFVQTSADGKALCVGIIRPSVDASGTREFPFTLFGTTPVSDHQDWLGHLTSYWTVLESSFTRLTEAADRDEFLGCAQSLVIGPSDSASGYEAFEQEPLSSWISRLYRWDPPNDFIRGLWRLKTCARFLEEDPRPLSLLSIRVPLDPKRPPGVQLEIWRRLVGQFHPRYTNLRSVYVPIRPAGGAKLGWLFYRPPEAEDFPAILGGMLPKERYSDLVDNEGRLPQTGIDEFYKQFETQLFQDPEQTIERLTSIEL